MEEGVRRAGGGFLIQISCGLTQQSLESKVTLGSLTVLYANRATHLASGAGLLRGYLCKSDWVRPYCQSTSRQVGMCAWVFTHIHTRIQAVIFHQGPGTPCFPRIEVADREGKDTEENRGRGEERQSRIEYGEEELEWQDTQMRTGGGKEDGQVWDRETEHVRGGGDRAERKQDGER